MVVKGRGGGIVVSGFAFYSNDASSSPAEAYCFSEKIVFEKNEKSKQKEAGVGHFFWKNGPIRPFMIDRQLSNYINM